MFTRFCEMGAFLPQASISPITIVSNTETTVQGNSCCTGWRMRIIEVLAEIMILEALPSSSAALARLTYPVKMNSVQIELVPFVNLCYLGLIGLLYSPISYPHGILSIAPCLATHFAALNVARRHALFAVSPVAIFLPFSFCRATSTA